MLTGFLNISLSVVLWLLSKVPVNLNAPVEANLIRFTANQEELDLGAERVFVSPISSRVALVDKNSEEIQSIASLTKLMTALIFLDNKPNWEEHYTIKEEDIIAGGKLNLFVGEKISPKDILATALIASDNGAAHALIGVVGFSDEEFIQQMNDKAKYLGLRNTRFVDVTGLSDQNVSTAQEVAKLAQEAFSRPDIASLTQLKDYSFKTLAGRDKFIESTNYLLFDNDDQDFSILGAKTGYTEKAGYCFVGHFSLPDGRELVSVVLNSDSKNERFRESKKILNWIFANYYWSK